MNGSNRVIILQKLSQLSDTHFSQVLNKLEKIFLHGFIKYHLPLSFPLPKQQQHDFKVKSSITLIFIYP